jgi:hypothetical protein
MDVILIGTAFIVATAGIILIFRIWQRVKQPAGQNLDQALRDELRQSRGEASKQARDLREEVTSAQSKANEVLVQNVQALGSNQRDLLGQLTKATQLSASDTTKTVQVLTEVNRKELDAQRDKIRSQLQEIQKITTTASSKCGRR